MMHPMRKRPLAVNFAEDQIARFDRIAEALSARAAGTDVTRSDAIRAAAERGATLLEAELGLIKKPKSKKQWPRRCVTSPRPGHQKGHF
jgi:hypothetical protein